MTVAELIAKLQEMPSNLQTKVWVYDEDGFDGDYDDIIDVVIPDHTFVFVALRSALDGS